MIVYQGKTYDFCNDVRFNRITDIMENNFYNQRGYRPPKNEKRAWQNSLSRISDLIQIAELRDNFIVLEYEIPYNQSRLDCLLYGEDENKISHIVLIELKQWESVTALPDEGNFKVETFIGGKEHIVIHPSQQVKGYHQYLYDFISEFENPPPLKLFSCAYCHNYSKKNNSGLLDPIYEELIKQHPLYCKEDVEEIAKELKLRLNNGKGFEIFNRFIRSSIKPSKKLLDNIHHVIKNDVRYSLINEQLIAKNMILSKIKKIKKNKINKAVIIVRGGPGTGKSVIALNILADLALKRNYVLYACKSKAFRDGLRSFVGKEARNLFTNLYSLVPRRIKENEIDALLIDEAHRIEKTSNNRYIPVEYRTDMSQIDQLIRCAKLSVFFIDDHQVVRSSEIGSTELIKESARKFNAQIDEVELHSQFRCMGSNDYLDWVESILGYKQIQKKFKITGEFDFRIFESPHQLYEELKKRELEKSNSARLTAGYCWKWSNPLPDGTLVKDVVIGDFAMPWETKGERSISGYPPWYEWAFKPKGFEQVGCIYTAQGFEFDYIGVIIGDDLYYDSKTDSLKCDISKTADPTLKKDKVNFEKYVKNIYRVLLTRGIKGCYIYFVNKETKNYFEKYIE